MTHDPHKNYYSDWQTPPEWLMWVEAILGQDYFDPCPEHPTFDGLQVNWGERVYCNPPGSNSIRSVREWWMQAMISFHFGYTERLVWCFFNNEGTRSLEPNPFEIPGLMIMPKKRVAFFRDGVRMKSPRNWTWFWVSGYEPIPSPPEEFYLVRTGG